MQKAKAGGQALSRDGYLQLERPSEREPVRAYGTVAPGLFDAIVNRCVDSGQPVPARSHGGGHCAGASRGARTGGPMPQICTAADAATIASLPVTERK